MTDYSNRPGGALFNKTQKTNPNQPDFDGYIVIDPAIMEALYDLYRTGQPARVEIAGWKKKSVRTGANFLSLSGGRIQGFEQQAQRQRPAPPPPQQWDDDDDIPF